MIKSTENNVEKLPGTRIPDLAPEFIIGVTGTSGKTTSTFLINSILMAHGKMTALVGTIENRIGATRFITNYTTPPAEVFRQLTRQMVSQGVTHLVAEISSHALVEGRVDWLNFDVAVYLNLSHEHLRFHKSMQAYAEAKARLFNRLLPVSQKEHKVAIVCVDDDWSSTMLEGIPTGVELVTISTRRYDSSAFVREVSTASTGISLRANVMGEDYVVRSKLVGRHNAGNILAALTVAHIMGIPRAIICQAIEAAELPPGRLQCIGRGRPTVFVDYAQTPAALAAALQTMRELIPTGGRLITVIGCGGDRDPGKRPMMGSLAATRSDLAIFTADNPRSESVQMIINHMASELDRSSSTIKIHSRSRAIRWAIKSAKNEDIVLVAGKGHECVQVLRSSQRFFSDEVEVRRRLMLRASLRVHCYDVPNSLQMDLGELQRLVGGHSQAIETDKIFDSIGLGLSVQPHRVAILSPRRPASYAETFIGRALHLNAVAVVVPRQLMTWYRSVGSGVPQLSIIEVADVVIAIEKVERRFGRRLWSQAGSHALSDNSNLAF
ncbi:Mur ligase family protein [Acidovorax sp. Root217]|uniref:Mur ligase family protein n=1 Tax=Acidovorax sp. Root217 TaxID=1736492 RepID=UPI000ACE19D9|nr:UDP-N-acetylmuramoyl-L-alanyl-D-glutamate--2,6-diaminopimelate ligase [Acidovorax sp. Root217]